MYFYCVGRRAQREKIRTPNCARYHVRVVKKQSIINLYNHIQYMYYNYVYTMQELGNEAK